MPAHPEREAVGVPQQRLVDALEHDHVVVRVPRRQEAIMHEEIIRAASDTAPLNGCEWYCGAVRETPHSAFQGLSLRL